MTASSLPSSERQVLPRGFERVAIGVGDDGGPGALALARALTPPHAVFVLVHVHRTTGDRGERPGPGGEDAVAHSLDLLRDARVVLGAPCEIVVEAASSVAEGLQRVAARESIDLLVVEAGEDPDAHRSTVSTVLRDARCAVAIASRRMPAGPMAWSAVGVAYQPTAEGRCAAAVARRLADEHGAAVHAITVIPAMVNPWLGPVGGAVQMFARLDGTLAQIARTDLLALEPDVDRVAEGDPVAELRSFSETVDLLVLGRHESGPLRRIFTDSTSDALASTCSSALLVVRHPTHPEAR